ncbi:unnamed protein product [Lota lota]
MASPAGLPGHHAPPITKHYHYVNQKMTWADAQRYCRERFGDLATVDNLEELKWLQESRNGSDYDIDGMWIGLYDDLTRWQWSHGNQDYKMGQHYGNWLPFEPNYNEAKENRTMMKKSTGQWNDEQQKQRSTFRLKISSEADMKDPEVQHHVVEQHLQQNKQSQQLGNAKGTLTSPEYIIGVASSGVKELCYGSLR